MTICKTDNTTYDVYSGSLLTAEEEVALAKRIENGDEDALQTMVEKNHRLAIHIADKCAVKAHLTKEATNDCRQEAVIGLLQAAKRFDYRRGVRFSTFASYWINQAAMSYIVEENNGLIRLPKNVNQDNRKIVQFEREFSSKYGRKPSVLEIMEETGISSDRIGIVQAYSDTARTVVSLDDTADDGFDCSIEAVIPDDKAENPENVAEEKDMRKNLEKALENLTPRERFVIKGRYGFDSDCLTLADLGKSLAVSTERVRQIEMKALRKLRRPQTKLMLSH